MLKHTGKIKPFLMNTICNSIKCLGIHIMKNMQGYTRKLQTVRSKIEENLKKCNEILCS